MKTSVACLLMIAVFFAACENQETRVQAYLKETCRLYQERHEDTAAIAKLLSQGLDEYPDSLPPVAISRRPVLQPQNVKRMSRGYSSIAGAEAESH
jgi:hypothetical protein